MNTEFINQLSETIEGFINEMYFSNANIIARKVGKIVGDIIISIIVDKGVKFVVKGLKGLIKSDKLATILNKIDNVDDTGKISDDTAKQISDDIDVEIRSNACITGGIGEAETLLLDRSKILKELDGLNSNKISHIIEGSKSSNHKWEKLIPDKNWNDIKNIISEVMETGGDVVYKNGTSKVKLINGELVQVTYKKLPNGTIKIGDAWVK